MKTSSSVKEIHSLSKEFLLHAKGGRRRFDRLFERLKGSWLGRESSQHARNLSVLSPQTVFRGAHASPRAVAGVSPETLFGGTPNTTRGDAYAPQSSDRTESVSRHSPRRPGTRQFRLAPNGALLSYRR